MPATTALPPHRGAFVRSIWCGARTYRSTRLFMWPAHRRRTPRATGMQAAARTSRRWRLAARRRPRCRRTWLPSWNAPMCVLWKFRQTACCALWAAQLLNAPVCHTNCMSSWLQRCLLTNVVDLDMSSCVRQLTRLLSTMRHATTVAPRPCLAAGICQLQHVRLEMQTAAKLHDSIPLWLQPVPLFLV